MKIFKSYSMIMLFLYSCLSMTGCSLYQPKHHSSSVVQFLYPGDKEPVVESSIPMLAFPLKAGIAFVPESTGQHNNLTEKDKMDLMQEISKDFKKYDFVKSIEIIPSAYLSPKGSFANLDQIRTMYNIDIIALVSYDQTQFIDEGLASITYWTLVGAYVVPGEKNDSHTMVDVAVYDIKSRKMLFRAPGISHIKSKATPINLSEQLRIDSMEGFRQASAELVSNLKIQLDLFREKVKQAPSEYKIEYKPGYTGGGSIDASMLIFISIMGGYFLWSSGRRKS